MFAPKAFIILIIATPFLSAGTTPSATKLTTAENPSVYGSSLTLTATVTPSGATGSVTFYSGVTVLETEPLVNGKATYATELLPAGPQALKAYYLGSATYASSTSASITQTVNAVEGTGFTEAAVQSVQESLYRIALGDFNGDGKVDIAAAVFGAIHGAAVFLGNGDGSFQSPVYYASPGSPDAIAVGDFNGDGVDDLVVTNIGSKGFVSVFLGNADGTFQSAQSTSLSYPPYGVFVADFNQDGKADIAFSVGMGLSSSLAVMLGNGDGTFHTPAIFGSGAGGDGYIAIADFNGDGKADIAADAPNSIEVFLGNGDGTFLAPLSYSSGNITQVLAWDVNGDGKPDLIYILPPAPEVYVALGNGDGTFQAALLSASGTPSGLNQLAIGDFNGDGKPDLAAQDPLTILLGNGDGTFQAPIPGGNDFGIPILVSDFNQDGRADLAYVNGYGVAQLVTLIATGDATTVNLTSSPNPSIYGETVNLTATVSTSTATGTMQFDDGSTTLGTSTITAGVATFEISTLAAGSHSLMAAYSGDANDKPSNSNVILQVVERHATKASLASSTNPATYQQGITLTATVSPASATGTVTFMHGTTALGTAVLTSGTASLLIAQLTVGAHSLSAIYSGDANNSTSTSPALDEVIVKAPTRTTLTSSPNPSVDGAPVTLTARVLPIDATGTVAFYLGTTSIGTATITGGKAIFVTSTLPSGSDSLAAVYQGSANDTASRSEAIIQVVQ